MPTDKAWCGVNRKTKTSRLERREWSKSWGVTNQRLHGASLLKRKRAPEMFAVCKRFSWSFHS